MEESDVIVALAALAHPARLRVFRALVVAGPKGMTPGALAEVLDVPASTLSFHLRELMRAGLTTQQRDGRSLIYRTAFDRMNGLMGYLTANCCAGEWCVEAGESERLLRRFALQGQSTYRINDLS